MKSLIVLQCLRNLHRLAQSGAKLPKLANEATPCFCIFDVAAGRRISEKNPAFRRYRLPQARKTGISKIEERLKNFKKNGALSHDV
jgi:hypothetical protein